MKRYFIWLAVLAVSVAVGKFSRPANSQAEMPQREQVLTLKAQPAEPPPRTAWVTTAAATTALPKLAEALHLPQGEAAETALLEALINLPVKDTPAALSLLLPSGNREFTRLLAEQWAGSDAAGALRFSQSPAGLAALRSAQGGEFQQGLFDALVIKNEAAAIDLAHRLGGPFALGNVFRSLQTSNPARAIQFAEQEPAFNNVYQHWDGSNEALSGQLPNMKDGPLKRSLLSSAWASLQLECSASGDASKLVNWWQALSPADQLHALAKDSSDAENLITFSKNVTEQDLQRLKATLLADPSLRQNTNLIQSVALLAGLAQPLDAIQWADTTFTGKARADALQSIVSAGVPKSLDALGPYLDALPPGPLRDQAALDALNKSEYTDPATLARWALTRTDPGERKNLIMPSISRWASADPTAVAKFLTQEIPPETSATLTAKVFRQMKPAELWELARALPATTSTALLAHQWREQPPDAAFLKQAAAKQSPGPLLDLLRATMSP